MVRNPILIYFQKIVNFPPKRQKSIFHRGFTVPYRPKITSSAEYVASLAPTAHPDDFLSTQIEWVATLLVAPPLPNSKALGGGGDGGGSAIVIMIDDEDISDQYKAPPSIDEE